MRRVAVTGLGAVSALGVGVAPFWQRLRAGIGGVRRITRFDPAALLAQAAGAIPDFNPKAHFDDNELQVLDPFAQYALVAADEAWRQAGTTVATQNGSGNPPASLSWAGGSDGPCGLYTRLSVRPLSGCP